MRLTACLMFAFAATTAAGQSNLLVASSDVARNTTVLPLWNQTNGQIDALLLIEPSVLPQLPSQRIISPANGGRPNNALQLRAGLSMEANPGMGVLCNSGSVITTVGSMAGHCMLVNLGSQGNAQIPGKTAINGLLQLRRSNALVTGSVGVGREILGAYSSPIGAAPPIVACSTACSARAPRPWIVAMPA